MTIINQDTQEKSQNPNQDESDLHQEEEETFTCEICIEPVKLPISDFKNSNRCIHPFCTDCMIKYIQVKLEDNVSDIKCPATTCDHSLDPLSCRPKLTHQLFNKWCDVLCESTVLEVDRVYCPNMECSGLILNECGEAREGNNLKRCECPYCKQPFCFKCKVSWHVGYSCDETRDLNDVAFRVISESEGWKRCPKCSHCIERTGGCHTITCRYSSSPSSYTHIKF
ncbi:hypothetical protein CTI12_AA397620 [Artemisia annua]|uniref:RBR-type E3 ubiquitin transferase n=1 Tax=Artemisia annua TaxID=35608 RepID=A0A2U1MAY9_ARTAN|nr:hypothetical protein CTI12_AA397620 [Artemisia annua]